MITKLFWFNILLKIADVAITWVIIDKYGQNGEANPFIRYLFSIMGVPASLIFVLVIAVGVLCGMYYVHIKYKENSKVPWIIITVIMSAVVINNLLVVFGVF